MDPLFGAQEVPESAFCSSWVVPGEYRCYSVVPGVFSPKGGIDVGATPRIAASSKGNDMGPFISNDSGNIQGSHPGLHPVAPPELKVDQRFERVDHSFEKVDQGFAALEAKISKLSDNLKRMGEKIDNRFDKIDNRFEKMDNRFTELHEVRSEFFSSGETTKI